MENEMGNTKHSHGPTSYAMKWAIAKPINAPAADETTNMVLNVPRMLSSAISATINGIITNTAPPTNPDKKREKYK